MEAEANRQTNVGVQDAMNRQSPWHCVGKLTPQLPFFSERRTVKNAISEFAVSSRKARPSGPTVSDRASLL